MNNEGQWVDSSAIRTCFKGTSLPPYLTVYGCQFKVEPYVFPVTQCSTCWKFGHMKRFCPHKIKCPKCGGEHENCDTSKFHCLNCKGEHLAIDKKCPMYLKEKNIRKIMSVNSWTYKKALSFYLQETVGLIKKTPAIPVEKTTSQNASTFDMLDFPEPPKSYSEITQNKNYTKNCNKDTDSIIFKCSTNKQRTKKQRKYMKQNNVMEEGTDEELSDEDFSCENTRKDDKSKKYKIFAAFTKVYNKLKKIVLSELTLEQKISASVKIVTEETIHWCINFMKKGNLMKNLCNILING